MGGGAKILLWDIIQNFRGVKNLIGVKKIRRVNIFRVGAKIFKYSRIFFCSKIIYICKKNPIKSRLKIGKESL